MLASLSQAAVTARDTEVEMPGKGLLGLLHPSAAVPASHMQLVLLATQTTAQLEVSSGVH